jgi:RNA polymerase sigma factor (sigma-70 family)
MKSKEKFDKIIELKNEGKTTKEIAIELALKSSYVCAAVLAFKNGFDSIITYCNYKTKRRINQETKNNFEDSRDYMNYRARKRGFKNQIQYNQFRRLFSGDNGKRSSQEDFESSIKLLPLERLSNLIYFEETTEEDLENREYLELLEKLPPKHRKVLKMRYLEGKTLRETGVSFNITYQAVSQLEKRAIESLLGSKIKINKRFEDGEILLAYILSKSFKHKNTNNLNCKEITNYFNGIYHDGERVRSSEAIHSLLTKSSYKRKIKKIRDKYFNN